jgi:hypothetical protein
MKSWWTFRCLEMVKYTWDDLTCNAAACGGHLDVLNHQHLYPLEENR